MTRVTITDKFTSTQTSQGEKNSTSWEELAWAALVFMYGDENVKWSSQSHEISVDIRVVVSGLTEGISVTETPGVSVS